MADMLLRDTDPGDFVQQIVTAVKAAVRQALNESNQPRLVDRNVLADALGVSVQSIDRLVKNAEIPSISVGSRRLFEVRQVIDALAKASGDSAGQTSKQKSTGDH